MIGTNGALSGMPSDGSMRLNSTVVLRLFIEYDVSES